MKKPFKMGACYWVIKHDKNEHYVDQVRIVGSMPPANIIYRDDAGKNWMSLEIYATEEEALKDMINKLDGYIDEEAEIIDDACQRIIGFRASNKAAKSRLEELNNRAC